MKLAQQFAAEGFEVSRYEYDDSVVVAADFGPTVDASVDVLGETVIVVVGEDQYEFEIDGDDPATTINNGVLTVEVAR